MSDKSVRNLERLLGEVEYETNSPRNKNRYVHGYFVLSVSYFICVLPLLLMSLARLHICGGFRFCNTVHCNFLYEVNIIIYIHIHPYMCIFRYINVHIYIHIQLETFIQIYIYSCKHVINIEIQ
jgi:hypothetical protein